MSEPDLVKHVRAWHVATLRQADAHLEEQRARARGESASKDAARALEAIGKAFGEQGEPIVVEVDGGLVVIVTPGPAGQATLIVRKLVKSEPGR